MAQGRRRPWTFYGRVSEKSEISRVLTSPSFFFCAISGRRRIGKTTLIREVLTDLGDTTRTLYVQVPDSDERGVVQIFRDAVEDTGLLAATVRSRRPGRIKAAAEIRTFNDMARAIGSLCRAGVIVVLDEFQYFHRSALKGIYIAFAVRGGRPPKH
jgi:AAA+ ATPase superfamily predicted ATPase